MYQYTTRNYGSRIKSKLCHFGQDQSVKVLSISFMQSEKLGTAIFKVYVDGMISVRDEPEPMGKLEYSQKEYL